ncbi:MAG: glutathione peroxidase, partial [Pseudomonas putida]
MRAHWLTVPLLAVLASTSSWAADCPAVLQGSLPELRGKGQVDLCQRFAGKPLVVVNTA